MRETLHILVTDDEEGMRLGVARALRGYVCRMNDVDAEIDYRISLAATGEEALAAIAQDPPAILLLDHKLPGMTGLDLLAHLAQRPPEEPAPEMLTVMITAYASLETAITATKRGAFDFLAKPFTPEELKAAIRTATRHLILQRQARRLAEEKRRVRFEFISVLAHELKAPLGAIEGYLDLLRDGTVSDAETQAHVIQRSLIRVHGMRKLIFDLLDLTRIEAGTKQRHLGPLDVSALAQEALETLLPAAQARGISLELDAAGPVEMIGDAEEVSIILTNLVSNAVKYNRDQGRVTVHLARAGDMVAIAVRDTGIGLSTEEAGRLFQDFVRIKNAKTRRIEGSGLGLSTVKKIAHLYDGEVRVQSEPEAGSTFTVTLRAPRAEETGPDVPAAEIADPAPRVR